MGGSVGSFQPEGGSSDEYEGGSGEQLDGSYKEFQPYSPPMYTPEPKFSFPNEFQAFAAMTAPSQAASSPGKEYQMQESPFKLQ